MYLRNKDSSDGIIKKPGKSTTPTKDESKRNNILDKLSLTIYGLGDG